MPGVRLGCGFGVGFKLHSVVPSAGVASAARTVTDACAVRPSRVSVMVAVPAASACTIGTPASTSTTAMLGALLLHAPPVIVRPRSSVTANGWA